MRGLVALAVIVLALWAYIWGAVSTPRPIITADLASISEHYQPLTIIDGRNF